MTKAELLKALGRKVRRAKPTVRSHFLQGLKYKPKPELEMLLKTVRVSRDGYDIRVG